uniref:uncharacterized protein n=1 Tax=Pristiophorus japonicus TaxID=55135 RepID=UPI00398E8304
MGLLRLMLGCEDGNGSKNGPEPRTRKGAWLPRRTGRGLGLVCCLGDWSQWFVEEPPRAMWPLACLTVAWACVGFSGSASVADKYSSLLPPGFPDAKLQTEDVMRWEYVTPGNKTPALEYNMGRSNPDRGMVNPSNRPRHLHELAPCHTADHGSPGRDQSNYENEAFILADTETETNKVEPAQRLVRMVHSSVRLLGFAAKSRESLKWSYLNSRTLKLLVFYGPEELDINSYYAHRLVFDAITGSIFLRDLKVIDSGTYEVILNPHDGQILATGDQIAYVNLLVQGKCSRIERPNTQHRQLRLTPEKSSPLILRFKACNRLGAPQIIQNPVYIMDRVALSCSVTIGTVNNIIWQKDNKLIANDSHFRLEFDSSTLFINEVEVSDCGLYTCTVRNEVSSNSNSHFLTPNEIVFIHEDTLVSSVVALVSTVTSFTATAFIIFTMDRQQVKKYWFQLISAIVIFHGLSLICQLNTFAVVMITEGFPVGYKAGSALGCIQSSIMMVYVVILFVQPQTEQSPSYLANNYKGKLFLACEALAVLIAILPIFRAKQNMKDCKFPYHGLAVKMILSVSLYLFGLGLFALFHAKFSRNIQINRVQFKVVQRKTKK